MAYTGSIMSAFDTVSEVLQEVADHSPEMAEFVQEALPRVSAMLQAEDVGWLNMFSGTVGSGDIPGPDIDEVKKSSKLAREMSVGSPLIARGLDLRTSYVWSKGLVIDGEPDLFAPSDGKRGPKDKKTKFFGEPSVQRHLLSSEAHKDMEAAAFTDGHYILLGDDKTKKLHPIPFDEISSVYLNPEYEGEIIAYRRTWTSYPKLGEPGVERSVWYYVDTYTGDRILPEDPKATTTGPTPEVDTTKTVFVKSFNTMVGWPLGVPDALPALKPARTYAEMVQVGLIVSKANAKFAYKTKSTTAAGAQQAAAKASNSKGVGNVAALGNNNDLISIPQANRSYDFNGIRPIASLVATSLNVSVVHILSDPGAAGSSYGSASNLDLPTKRAMVSRQEEWVDFIQRILAWGTGEPMRVSFPSLDDPDPYREGQLLTMVWNSGLVGAEEIRPRMIEVAGVSPLQDKAPTGVMLPNNEKSLNRRDIDADGEGGSSNSSTGVSSTASSPDQGSRNGTGGVSDSTAKDLRNEAALELIMDQMRQLSVQFEALGQVVESRGYLDE